MTTQTPKAPPNLFNNLNSSYGELYSQSTLQTTSIQNLISLLPPNSKILDIGCASGIPNALLLAQAHHHVTGIDYSPQMIAQARKNVPTAEFHHVDARNFTAKEKTYDAIVCSLALLSQASQWNRTLCISHRALVEK
ncbi:uncharacterized protein RCC_04284 [Ramularia collo-cygni]|uniref:Methyltransferase domain-containing protein n=1 Tax=Ramularia collo-cygni TaxID=112498 RepID=A0A2D3VA82_9PEZI|nr:uncharacterized protein RCC_04284 [Ramularia collo-cygni]CZT18439.1 uncharacterized protein RCC_04284 [Ramularia collo-cygni]